MKLVKIFFFLFCGTAGHEKKKTENTTTVKRHNLLMLLLALPIMALSLPNAGEAVTIYTEPDLVWNIVTLPGAAPVVTDPNLKTPRGVTRSTTSRFQASDTLTRGATLYSGDDGSMPISIIPLVVSVVGSSTVTTLADFVVADRGASGPAIFIFSNLNGTTAGWSSNAHPRPPQNQGPLGSNPVFHASVPQPHSLLLVLSGIAMIVAARQRLKR